MTFTYDKSKTGFVSFFGHLEWLIGELNITGADGLDESEFKNDEELLQYFVNHFKEAIPGLTVVEEAKSP